ncbi:hypothetical protein NQ317_010695 [Molorchus minor]|uniref:Uncharacterized protein n=1 Tax=Molorchus minor TaxID=1323400 RepID=A0ABQ9K5S9_9CUCU|nr:hypothetical protein NQ317_010695 [Molorchus minor]
MDQSFENIRPLIDELISFRKRGPQDIYDMYARNNKEMLKCLKEVNIKLQNSEIDYNISDNCIENVNLKQFNQYDEKLRDEMYEQIQLLSILLKKKKCPISKIIDEI